MSQLTNYGENLTADFFRGQGLAALPPSFFIGLASAASDSGITELSGTGYSRPTVGRGLTQWAGTQASGTTLASNGSTHVTSNNNTINWGTAGSAWGTATHAVLYDGATGGNAIAFMQLATPLSISNGSPVNLGPGKISFSVALVGVSDYLVNKYIDTFFRGALFTFPSYGFFALFTTAPTNGGGGVEVGGGSYARVTTPFSPTGFSSTNGAGTTNATSTGTGGVISNNFTLAFPTPTANWGTIEAEGVFDAASGGNLLFWNPIETRSILAASSPQTHAPGSWTITVA